METIVSLFGAFFIGGAICALFQVIGDYTKAAPPKILLVGIPAGALLTALGVMAALGEAAGAGTGILVIGLGEAVYHAIHQLFGGDWSGVLTLLVVLSVFFLMGAIAGAAHRALVKKEGDRAR